jgi:type 1 fimbriae regulatory protein FimB/type 1 fimbriae regulatory protein FimE
MPRAKRTAAKRRRDYILPQEVDLLLDTALQTGRHGHRNYTLILLGYRHGLKLGDLTDLRWRMVDLKGKKLQVTRGRNRVKTVHPLRRDELVALRKLKRDYPGGAHVFMTDRGGPLTGRSVSRVITEAGEAAGIKISLTPRVLRRGCAYALVSAGHNILAVQEYLRFGDIEKVLRYLELPRDPFRDFWK